MWADRWKQTAWLSGVKQAYRGAQIPASLLLQCKVEMFSLKKKMLRKVVRVEDAGASLSLLGAGVFWW